MPINIYRDNTVEHDQIAWLCDEDWDLSSQVEALNFWIEEKAGDLLVGSYVADIGFCWRRNAKGGGAVLSSEAMKKMSDLGLSLYLSEYSGFSDSDT